MKATVAALCLVATAQQALALSCVAPDPLRAFAEAAAAPEVHIVVQGSFAFEGAFPEGGGDTQPEPKAIPARFTGHGLTAEGFTTPLSMWVTLDASCLGPWCGSLAPETEQLAFLERRVDGYHLAVGPCPTRLFAPADVATAESLQACIAKPGACGG
ncbi:hypothetical protein [Oceaniglobus roseus]|uniref:hypothetical protein n=1 Tax=Oceaniglobus roseus TaxID=1737570 RepID=UPI000C7F0339|nr:hypothetical protein [Kandeliimicrobium roseum]